MTLCHHESEKFSRCVVVQGKILRALGFASIGAGAQTDGRGEEGIQIHADHLYHEMLEREEIDERLGKGVGDAAALEKLRQKRHEEREKLRQRLDGIYWLSEKNKTAHFHEMNVVEANLELDAMETDRKITGERWSTIPGFVKQSEDEIKRRIEARDDEGWFTWLGRWMAAGARTNDKT